MQFRPVRTAAIAAGSVLLLAGTWRWLDTPAPAVIGDYSIPTLPGWERKFTRDFQGNSQTDSVTFRRSVGAARISMSFRYVLLFHKKTPYPATLPELRAAAAGDASAKMVPAQFQGKPALLIQRFTRRGDITTSEKRLDIGDPRGRYDSELTVVTNGNTVPPVAQAQADQAWFVLNSRIGAGSAK